MEDCDGRHQFERPSRACSSNLMCEMFMLFGHEFWGSDQYKSYVSFSSVFVLTCHNRTQTSLCVYTIIVRIDAVRNPVQVMKRRC